MANNKVPVVWSNHNFAYYSRDGYNGALNGWEYYFEPLSDYSYGAGDVLHGQTFYQRDNNFSTLWWYHQYIENMHLLPEDEQKDFVEIDNHMQRYKSAEFNQFRSSNYRIGNYHLYDKCFRKWVKENIIDSFIKIKPSILKKITDFKNEMIDSKIIGIHLRGKHLSSEVIHVPLPYIFDEANKFAGENVKFFIATDQEPLLEEAKKCLKGQVMYYPCQRFSATTSPYYGSKLHPKQGEEILIETILLSCCDHLIHTLSNVSTAALYFNPELGHTLIY
ncbi:MAG: hypothetical protein AB7E68_02625 [Candidatus Babeliales bacterium]